MSYRARILILLACFLGSLTALRNVADSSRTVSSKPVGQLAERILPIAPLLFSAGLKLSERKRASHPLVSYQNPGEIKSFSDPELDKAFDIYFSLVGDAREQYRYHDSGFDTEFNSRLAFETVTHPGYFIADTNIDQEFRTVLQAIEHLKRSELPASYARLISLAVQLSSEVDSGGHNSYGELRAADLANLLEAPALSQRDLLALYRSSNTQISRTTIAFAIFKRLERENVSREGREAYFYREKLQPLSIPRGIVPAEKVDQT